ncbi:4Fe-4S dicluster domain-containing protein [Lacrimispora celerecrescens]
MCPKSAISMVEDEEGFEYPQVDEAKCIRCYMCLKVCPIKVVKR